MHLIAITLHYSLKANFKIKLLKDLSDVKVYKILKSQNV